MRPSTIRRLLIGVSVGIAAAVGGSPVLAQRTVVLRGRVTELGSGRPLVGALVQTPNDTTAAVVQRVLTRSGGRFVLAVPNDAHDVRATLLGYEPRVAPIPSTPSSGDTIDVELALAPLGIALDPIVVTASRSEERASAAPATVTVVQAAEVEEKPSVTPVEHVREAPGVDIATTGIIQSHIVTRGFNGVFSGALLVLTDYRFDIVPSLRVNEPWLIPATNSDIDRIEVVLGPAAALYGPNAAAGVLQIFTKSPFDSPGTTLSVGGLARSGNANGPAGGGEQLALRHANTIGTRFGYKVAAQYLSGSDWRGLDSAEVNARRDLINGGMDSTRIVIGKRDFAVSRWSVEGEAQFRPDEQSELDVGAGRTHAGSAIELTGVGAVQVRDWSLDYYQARFRRGDLFAQAFANVNQAGNTFLLRSGDPVVDQSRMFVGQIQNATGLGARETLTYGLDFQRTEPRTGGTIDGRNENDDNIDESGGYLQSETHLTPRLDAILSGRVDWNDRLPNAVFSPRAALQFRPVDGHILRLTYNRAFETPTPQDLFSDLVAVRDPGGLPFDVRSVGVPRHGFTFARNCGGATGLCMRSPFTGEQAGAVDATTAWATVVKLANLQGWGDLSGVPAPTAADVSSVLRLADISGAKPSFVSFDPNQASNVPGLQPSVTNTIEGGYKGRVGDHFRVALDVYYEWRRNFVGPPQVITPLVFLDATSLATYLAKYMSPAEATGLATKIGGTSGSTTDTGLPLGTISPTGEYGGGSDVLVTYRNFGSLHRVGSDVGAQWAITDAVSLTGAYSWTNKTLWSRAELGGISDLALNAPGNRASFAVQRRDASRGYSVYARARYVGAFPMNSGVYVGDVAAYTLVDAGFAYRLPRQPDLLLTVSADNILDKLHQEFIGAPQVGRLIMAQVEYTVR